MEMYKEPYKKLTVELYMMEPASRRFKGLADNKTIGAIFDYLAGPDQVKRMIAHSESGRPAMEALIEDVEALFPEDETFDLMLNNRHRQIMGSMIRYIMGHYGYWPGKAKILKKGKYIKTAIVFYR